MTKVAVIGAMDILGREILSFLAEDGVKAADVVALEPNTPVGNQVSYGEDDDLDVQNLDGFDFSKVKIAIFAGTIEQAKRFLPKISGKCKIIDCSGFYASNPDVPMIVAGINDSKAKSKSSVSVPGFNTAQLLPPLKSIDDEYKIKRIVLSTYTSASVYGKGAMDELFNQTKKIFQNDSLFKEQKVFKKQIAFNAIPQVGEFIGEETKSEWEINSEVKKVLNPEVKTHANCCFVPAFIGNAQYVNVECEKDLDVDDVKKLMQKTKDIVVFDKHTDGGYVTLTDVQGENNIYISRLRQDTSVENGFSFWSVADNLRACLAKNAFNVMKLLLSEK